MHVVLAYDTAIDGSLCNPLAKLVEEVIFGRGIALSAIKHGTVAASAVVSCALQDVNFRHI
jgi:hypothetical protein